MNYWFDLCVMAMLKVIKQIKWLWGKPCIRESTTRQGAPGCALGDQVNHSAHLAIWSTVPGNSSLWNFLKFYGFSIHHCAMIFVTKNRYDSIIGIFITIMVFHSQVSNNCDIHNGSSAISSYTRFTLFIKLFVN